MYKEYEKIHNYETLEYDRKSRSDDPLLTVDEILARHEAIINDYAEKYLGGPIPQENKYKEVGSAESIDSRPEMLRLLKAIENPAIKAVAVVEVQRLSRGDLEDAGRLIKILRYTNTYVITPTKTYDLRDEYDRDAFERELKRGNEYLEYFKKIQQRGKLASVRDGNYVGSTAPFGFNRVQVKDGKKTCWILEEKKDEADIVRMIFQWYCNDDVGVKAICRRLEAMNIKTKSGYDNWYPSMIFDILENVHYIGLIRWNWRKTDLSIENQEVKKKRPKVDIDECLIFNGKHDGIISEELFKKAAEIRGSRHRTKNETTLKNPFSGLMYCKCGSKIGYNTFTRHGVEYAKPKLRCNSQVRCKTGSADFNEVLEYICDSLAECIADFELRITNNEDDSVKIYNNIIENTERKLKELEKQEVMQWEAQYHPDPDQRMPAEIFARLNKKLLLEKEELKEVLRKAYESVPKPVDYADKVVKFTQALEALRDPSIPATIKNQYLKDIIERIDYDRPPITRLPNQSTPGLFYNVEPYKITIKIKP